MTRTGMCALAAVVSLGIVACDRGNKTSETTTTSANVEPVESTPTVDLPSVTHVAASADMAKDAGHAEWTNRSAGWARDAGHANDEMRDMSLPPSGMNGSGSFDDTVGPGHIFTPPGMAPPPVRGSGDPNSAGSHNIGK